MSSVCYAERCVSLHSQAFRPAVKLRRRSPRHRSVLFLLLITTFLCWGALLVLLRGSFRRIKERVATRFLQSAYSHTYTSHLTAELGTTAPPQSTRPIGNPPGIHSLAPINTQPLGRQHGPDSVDTLPPYTPSEEPSPSSTEMLHQRGSLASS